MVQWVQVNTYEHHVPGIAEQRSQAPMNSGRTVDAPDGEKFSARRRAIPSSTAKWSFPPTQGSPRTKLRGQRSVASWGSLAAALLPSAAARNSRVCGRDGEMKGESGLSRCTGGSGVFIRANWSRMQRWGWFCRGNPGLRGGGSGHGAWKGRRSSGFRAHVAVSDQATAHCWVGPHASEWSSVRARRWPSGSTRRRDGDGRKSGKAGPRASGRVRGRGMGIGLCGDRSQMGRNGAGAAQEHDFSFSFIIFWFLFPLFVFSIQIWILNTNFNIVSRVQIQTSSGGTIYFYLLIFIHIIFIFFSLLNSRISFWS
jgi:hypothetical protein